MSYRPPHRRDAPSQPSRTQNQSNVQPSGSSGIRPNVSNAQRPPRQSNVQQNSGTYLDRNGIQSARDLRPSRLIDAKVDEMDMVQSVSRSGGDGAEGDA